VTIALRGAGAGVGGDKMTLRPWRFGVGVWVATTVVCGREWLGSGGRAYWGCWLGESVRARRSWGMGEGAGGVFVAGVEGVCVPGFGVVVGSGLL